MHKYSRRWYFTYMINANYVRLQSIRAAAAAAYIILLNLVFLISLICCCYGRRYYSLSFIHSFACSVKFLSDEHGRAFAHAHGTYTYFVVAYWLLSSTRQLKFDKIPHHVHHNFAVKVPVEWGRQGRSASFDRAHR